MAIDIVGYGGNFAFAGTCFGDWNAWTLTLDNRVATYGTFASRWLKNKPTLSQLTGSVTGVVQYDASSTQPIPLGTAGDTVGTTLSGVTGACTFTATTGCTMSGNFVFTNVTLSRDVNAQMIITGNVASDGGVTIAWDTTTS